MFLRESEGVYQFGSRKVYIKIEKGDAILVRVGGGYMHIHEFIKQYMPLEVDKLQNKDVLTKFQNKTTVQQIAINADDKREQSPIRMPRRPKSPLKSPSRKF